MIEANGKYKETKHIEIAASVLNIILSLILVRIWGIKGVVLATVFSYAVIKQPLQNKYIYNGIFNKKTLKSMGVFLLYTIVFIAICLLNMLLVNSIGLFNKAVFINWLASTLLILVIDSIICFVPMYFLDKSFKNAVKRFINKRK